MRWIMVRLDELTAMRNPLHAKLRQAQLRTSSRGKALLHSKLRQAQLNIKQGQSFAAL
jgi:hypothetical protein